MALRGRSVHLAAGLDVPTRASDLLASWAAALDVDLVASADLAKVELRLWRAVDLDVSWEFAEYLLWVQGVEVEVARRPEGRTLLQARRVAARTIDGSLRPSGWVTGLFHVSARAAPRLYGDAALTINETWAARRARAGVGRAGWSPVDGLLLIDGSPDWLRRMAHRIVATERDLADD